MQCSVLPTGKAKGAAKTQWRIEGMFESICFRRMQGLGDRSPLDVGILAEALLFYGRVHLIAERDMLRQLVARCGPAAVVALMEERFLEVAFLTQPAGIGTQDAGPSEAGMHEFVSHVVYDLGQQAEDAFRAASQDAVQRRDLVRRFTALAHPISYDDDLAHRFAADLDDTTYSRSAVEKLLQILAPGYVPPPDLQFDIAWHGRHCRVRTNLDFPAVNAHYRPASDARHVRQLDTPLLLLYLLEARSDLEFAARFGAEVATSPAGSALMKLRLGGLLPAAPRHTTEIAAFEDLFLPEGHCIREVIDAGERTYDDVLALLRRARRFRTWLADQDIVVGAFACVDDLADTVSLGRSADPTSELQSPDHPLCR